MNRVCLERDIHVLPFPNPVQFVECIHKLSIGLLERVDLDVQRRSLIRALLQERIESWGSDQFEIAQSLIQELHEINLWPSDMSDRDTCNSERRRREGRAILAAKIRLWDRALQLVLLGFLPVPLTIQVRRRILGGRADLQGI